MNYINKAKEIIMAYKILTIYKNNTAICRGVFGCEAWARKVAPVLVGMGYAVKMESAKQLPFRNTFEQKLSETIINKAYALLDNLFEAS